MIVETFSIVKYYVQIYQPALILLSATSLMEECAQGTGMRINFEAYVQQLSGFGGLGLVCWPLVPKFAGSNPAEAIGFLGQKNPQLAFLRRGSKAVGPMS